MSLVTKVLIGLGATFALFAVLVISSVIGLNNELVRHETGLEAQYKQNQNNYDNYIKKVAETAQVPDMMRDDLIKVYNSALSARYGSEGSKAMFQWLKEQNPNLDATLYTKIQQIIDSGRNSFQADQKMLLDKKRVYETSLREFPTNLIAGALGFPKIDLNKIDIVTSDDTQQAFDTKKSAPVQLRKGN